MKNNRNSTLRRGAALRQARMWPHSNVLSVAPRRSRHGLSRSRSNHYTGLARIVVPAINVVLATVIAVLVTVVFIEAAVGCGQSVHAADGTWSTGQCVFLASSDATGLWR